MGRSPDVFAWDGFRLDLDTYRLERHGVPIPLEPKALDVLSLLVRRPGHLFTKQEIFEAAWPDTAVTDHALTRVIAQLRRALGDASREARYIETVPTRGYRWIHAVDHVSPSAPPEPAAPSLPAAPSPAPRAQPPSAGAPAPTWVPRWAASWPALLLLSLLLLAAGWTGRVIATPDTPPAAPAGVTPRTLPWPAQATTHAGLDLTPALSPRGDALAFASDRSGAMEIYVRPQAAGAMDVPLTTDGGQNLQPAWSPDGTLIAYHSNAHGGIWVMPARGGVARQIVTEGSNPDWSPDGQRLAYQTDEHMDVTPSAYGAQAGSTLWVVGADGSGARAVTRPGQPTGGHAYPVWSPDARFLAFSVFEGGADDGAWLAEVETGGVVPLVRGRKLYELAFALDGSALYITGGEALIYRLAFDPVRGRADGPLEPIVVPGVTGVRGLSLANGRLAFAGLSLSSQIWAQRVGPGGDGLGDPAPLTMDTSRRNSMAVVSPDGARVAYTSSRRGESPNVWLMNIDGSSRLPLTSDAAPEGKPAWFPDSRRVAFFSNRGEVHGLWTVDAPSRREMLLMDVGARTLEFFGGRLAEMELSPSMTRAAFTLVGAPDATRRLYVTALDAFEPRPLSAPGQWVGYPAWSPDERHLAVEIKDGSSTHAGVIEVATGTLRRVSHERGQTWVRSWSPDGRRIAVAALRGGLWSLRWIDVATGATGVISPTTAPNVYMRYPEWSRRNDVVVYERGELRGNIWMLPLS